VKKFLFIVVLIFPLTVYSQYKDKGIKPNEIKEGIVNTSYNNIFGFINPDNFFMHHSFEMSYSAFANQGVALGMYTNSMMYKFSKNLNVQMDVSVVNSPYSTLGKDFQKNINGIYISNAAINFKPWDDVSVHLQYRNLPYSTYYYSPYSYWPYSGFYRSLDSPLFDSEFNEQ